MNLIRTHIAGLCMLALNHHYLVHISKQLRHIQCLLDESRTWINYFLKRQFLKKLLMIQDILIIRYLVFFVFLCSFSYLRVRIKCVRSFGVIWFLPDCQTQNNQTQIVNCRWSNFLCFIFLLTSCGKEHSGMCEMRRLILPAYSCTLISLPFQHIQLMTVEEAKIENRSL